MIWFRKFNAELFNFFEILQRATPINIKLNYQDERI